MEPGNDFPSDFLLNSTTTASSPNPTLSIPNVTAPFPSSSLTSPLPVHANCNPSLQINPHASAPFLILPTTNNPPPPPHHHVITADLQFLSNRLPPAPPATPNSTALILHLLNPLTPQWISDFLFTPDPTHIPLFSRPPPSNTLLLNTNTTRLHCADLQTPFNRPATHVAASVLLLPAFCIETRTLGFGVAQGLELQGLTPDITTPANAPAFRKHLRFLHDATNHSLLLLIDSPAEDTLIIAAWWHQYLTTTRTISARLHRRTFLTSLRQHQNVPSLDLLMTCLISITDQAQFRTCPRCGSAYSVGCGCEPCVRRARHAYDFVPFRESMGSGFGSFVGSGFRHRGEEVRSFGVVSRILRGVEERLLEEMMEWGLNMKGFQVEGDDEDLSFGFLKTTLESDSSDEPMEECSVDSVGKAWAGGEGGEVVKSVSREEEKSPEELARLRRAMDRRERNRLAARRSNRKKKQERDAKKAELESLKRREDALRKREASLRREQALLKELVTAREDRMGRD